LRISKNDRPIESVESWFELAPPKEGLRQWVDQRSAKELAKAFCGSGAVVVPDELIRLLNSNPSLGSIEMIEAWPEHKIALDSFRGETRNADLAGLAKGNNGMVAVTVEAKADEPFGELVATALAGAKDRSNVPARIKALARGLFGGSAVTVSGLRYQLLHGVAASLTLAAEHQAAAAVFAVLEFRGPSCSEDNLQRNAQDLDKFVALLGGSTEPVRLGQLAGPFTVPGGGTIPAGVPLFLGKAIRDVGGCAV
jgi:hypothetical protein